MNKNGNVKHTERAIPTLFIVFMLSLYIAILGYTILTRTCDFSDPDTMNFVDVARNISAGRGISQSTLGFNEPRFSFDAEIPMPLTAQPPVYPLLISALSLTGLSCTSSALCISIFCYGLILVLAYCFAQKIYGSSAALLSVLLLLLYEPLRKVTGTAFSESLGLAFIFSALLALAHICKSKSPTDFALSLFAGFLTGMAFSTRYALFPMACAGGIYIGIETAKKVRCLALYGLGFIIPAGLVWLRNFLIIGKMMPEPNPSQVTLFTNIKMTVLGFLRLSPNSLPSYIAPLATGLIILACVGVIIRQRRLREATHLIFLNKGSYMLLLTGAGYLAFLIIQRTRVHFDYINWRLLLPAGLVFILFLAGCISLSINFKRNYIALFLTAVTTFLIARELNVAVHTPRYRIDEVVRSSDKLSWIAKNTDENDLIIGVNTVDIAFLLHRGDVVSISSYPYCDYLAYTNLVEFCRTRIGYYTNIYLILPTDEPQDCSVSYGNFIHSLVNEKKTYPGIALYQQLSKSYIFRISNDGNILSRAR